MSSDQWTILGTLIGAVSLVLAGVQTVRYQVAKRLLARLNEREQLANWALYDLLVQAYDSLAEARHALKPGQPTDSSTAAEKTAQVASLLNATWLLVIQHAAMLEPSFDEAAIGRWKKAGRLDTTWREERARKLLPNPTEQPLP